MKFEAFAKIIVAGEHSVLRGAPAIIVPVKNKIVSIRFSQGEKFLSLCTGNHKLPNCEKEWERFLLYAFKQCSSAEITGEWHINIDIPIGVGLGFSSAICVALSKTFAKLSLIKESEVFSFAHSLEQPMHGKSSGCDIAGSMSNSAIMYKMINQVEVLNWLPKIAWSTPSTISTTKNTIKKVEQIGNISIDKKMHDATLLAYNAWKAEDVNLLADSIQIACSCFDQWGLIPKEMRNHMELLKTKGALATKPTGAGGGGSVLSLWPQEINIGDLNWII